MRLCVFGDIHANLPALKAARQAMAAEDPDAYLCTGDLVIGFADPAACVDALAAMGCPVVTGNQDQVALGAAGFGVPAGSFLGRRAAWTAAALGPARRRWLASAPCGLTWRLRGTTAIAMAHGGPPDRIEPGIAPEDLQEWAGTTIGDAELGAAWRGEAPGLFLCGHTHVPMVRRLGATLIVNPGSVGFGIHPAAPARYQAGNALARYAVIDWIPAEGWRAALRAVPYDPAPTLAALEGLPWAQEPEGLASLRRFFALP